jgi:hypothetical protein
MMRRSSSVLYLIANTNNPLENPPNSLKKAKSPKVPLFKGDLGGFPTVLV